MWIRNVFAGGLTLAALGLFLSDNVEAQKDQKDGKELTVKEIMIKAHAKDGLRVKVMNGKASNDEKKALIDLYTALAASKNPKGDEADWKVRTKKVVDLVKSGDAADLKKIDCAGCHKAFK